MAKPLLKTQNPFSPLLMIFLFSTLLLNNVKSESLSFSFSYFGSGEQFTVGFLGDARPSGGVIQLTRRDNLNMSQHSVGRAVYVPPVHLWDRGTGKVADFDTEFSFVVDSGGSQIHADGLSFFIIPFDADPRPPKNSSGGYLGLFSPNTAFNSYQNQIVAVELDSFGNEWDPNPTAIAPHIGIDINSLKSVTAIEWPSNEVPEGSKGTVHISYDSKAKELSVVVGYRDTKPNLFTILSQTIDLSTVLPEWVRIGFSGATGNKVETNDILSWSFSSSL